jgi:hypothetical protein
MAFIIIILLSKRRFNTLTGLYQLFKVDNLGYLLAPWSTPKEIFDLSLSRSRCLSLSLSLSCSFPPSPRFDRGESCVCVELAGPVS